MSNLTLVTILSLLFVFFSLIIGLLTWVNRDKESQNSEKKVPSKKGWWARKSRKRRLWFLYTALMVIAILIAYTVPYYNNGEYTSLRFQIGGYVALLVLHIVIWPFYSKKTSFTKKVVVTSVLLFVISAVLAPNAAERFMASVDNKIKEFDQNAFKEASIDGKDRKTPKARSAIPWNKMKWTTPVVVTETAYVPIGIIPLGVKKYAIRCQGGMLLVWTDSPLHGKTVDCDKEINGKDIGYSKEPLHINLASKDGSQIIGQIGTQSY